MKRAQAEQTRATTATTYVGANIIKPEEVRKELAKSDVIPTNTAKTVNKSEHKDFFADDDFANMEKIVHTAFDLGIVHFDISNKGHSDI